MRQRSNNSAFSMKPIAASLLALGFSTVALAAPQDGVVRAGSASISQSGGLTQIQQSSERAVIDWRSFSIGSAESVNFSQPSRQSATLNRVTGDQVSMILGKLSANGQVALINPNGIVFGVGSQIDVGGLIAATANISNKNFMEGRLVFDQAGNAGAGIINQGTISAAEGGLVALVAPTVRNDGIIQARLGKVVLGAGDTFTLDLYGDQLINLAMAPEQVAQVVQTGQITADGGKVVLVAAPTAKSVLDQVINMSGTIRADSIAEQDGKIVLMGSDVTVSGQLSAQGNSTGERGGTIEVLGDHIHLTDTAKLDVDGQSGGGVIHVGGAWQGSGDTYRAQHTNISQGAQLSANALDQGNGGEIVVWADQHTTFAGDVQARGGVNGGDGGRMEVSGKGTLDFLGTADASAPQGRNGSLLLDPTDVSIGAAEASLINRVLRTGTSTAVTASNNIDVNALIDGRGGLAGGGLTLTAGNLLNINEFIVTNNGAINLNAGNTINLAAGKAVFAGTANITATNGGDLNTIPLLSSGTVTYRSTGGSVFVNRGLGSDNGAIVINAAQNVFVDQPIVNFLNGSSLDITAGGDINVNAQIDGRGGIAGGTASLNAGHDLNINSNIITNNGTLSVLGGNTLAQHNGAGLFAGSGTINVSSGGNYSPDKYETTGTLNLSSLNGNLIIASPFTTTGVTNLSAGNSVVITSSIDTNSNALTITGGTGGIQVTGSLSTNSSSLTLRAQGDIDLFNLTYTASNVFIDTRGAVRQGTVSNPSFTGPLFISADQGIGTLSALNIPLLSFITVSAFSLNGDINIGGTPYFLTAGTGFNASSCIFTPFACVLDPRTIPLSGGSVSFGGTPRGALIVAGGNIFAGSSSGTNTLTSGQSITAGKLFNATLLAKNNISFTSSGTSSAESTNGNIQVQSASGSGLTLSAVNGSVTVSNVALNDTLQVNAGQDINIQTATKTSNLALSSVNGSVTLNDINISGTLQANAGQDINIQSDLGTIFLDFLDNPVNFDIANVFLNAGGNISTQAIRAVNLIDIGAIGTFTSNGQSIFSQAGGSPVTINSSNVSFTGNNFLGSTIGTAPFIPPPNPTDGVVITPSPTAVFNFAPLASNPSTVSVNSNFNAPGGLASGGGTLDDSASRLVSNGSARFDEIIPEGTLPGDADTEGTPKKDQRIAFVYFTGGRGIAQEADLGRSASFGPGSEVFGKENTDRCDQSQPNASGTSCGK